MTIRIHGSADALADAVADEVEGWLSMVDRTKPEEPRNVGLAGGSTPRLAYRALRQRSLPWRNVHGWMTDERHVPRDHADSNARMVRETLFDHVTATLHEVEWNDDPALAAAAYQNELATILPRGPLGLQPGLVLLGIGEDGHTASLFPGTAALEDDQNDYIANEVPGKGWRLTATMGLLARARRTIFVVSGAHKADIVAEIVSGGSDLPAAVVAGASRDVVWLLDSAAASQL